MPFCPSCRSEYRPEIKECVHCEKELVEALPESDAAKGDRLRQAAAQGEAATIMRATYPEACQVVEQLHTAGIDAMVTGDPDSCAKGGQCSHFFVALLKEDVPPAIELLRSEWRKLLDVQEGAVLADPDAALDFDAEGEKACPACGTKFEGKPEECPECGLFLGAA